MKAKHSKWLLISAILGLIYSIYIITNFGFIAISSESGAEFAGVAVATALVTPNIILVVLAIIFNWIAYFSNKRGFALNSGILYSVSSAAFMMVIPLIVLSFVGYAKLKDIIQENNFNQVHN